MRLMRLVIMMAFFALVVAACSPSEEAETTTAPAAPGTTAAPDTTEAAPDTTEAAPDTTAAPAEPIIIGAAIDQSGNMAPFNNPPNLAAQIMIERINASGGVLGRPLELITIDTTLDPDQTKAVALDLIEQGAVMLLVTCDFDFAAPAAQEAVAANVLAVTVVNTGTANLDRRDWVTPERSPSASGMLPRTRELCSPSSPWIRAGKTQLWSRTTS